MGALNRNREAAMPDVPLSMVHLNSELPPRQPYRQDELLRKAESIRSYGVLDPEPIVVVPRNGHYVVATRERTFLAAALAGLTTVPVIVRDYSDEELREISLIENVQRGDLSAVEKAKLCQEIRDRYPDRYKNWDSLATRIGLEVETIRAWIRTLDLPLMIQSLIASRERPGRVPEGKIDYQTALRVAEKIKDPERQIAVVERLASARVPHRIANEIIRKAAGEPTSTVGVLVRQVVQQTPSLSFSHRNYQAIMEGVKTQTTRRRLDLRIKAGKRVVGSVTRFADLEIEEVEYKPLGQMTEKDALAEGAPSLAEFKKQWVLQYGSWDADEVVYLVRFRILREL